MAAAGGRAIAVVSDDERGKYAMQFGAIGYINRKDFTHWGIPPLVEDTAGQREWSASARKFGKQIWEIAGSREDPTGPTTSRPPPTTSSLSGRRSTPRSTRPLPSASWAKPTRPWGAVTTFAAPLAR